MLTKSTAVTAPAVAILIALLAGPARAQEGGDPETDQAEKAPDEATGEETAEEAGPSAEDLEKAKAHFAKGKELFDAKDFEGAVEEFKESYKLSKNPLLLYNVGFTLDELDDNKLALFYYKKFLEDAPKAAQNRGVVSARVKELEAELSADSQPEPDAGGEGKGEKAAKPDSIDEFQHNVIDEVPPGKPVDVTAFVPEGADWQVMLFYRSAGEARFDSVEMRPRYNELVGRIPAKKTSGVNTVQYYIEVKDRAGEVVERSGRSTSPNLIFISEDAKPRYYPDLDTETGFESAGGEGGGGGSLVGGGTAPTPDSGKWTDVRSSKFQYTKWGVTGGAVGLLALSATFYFLASDAGSSLEGEAVTSQMEPCPTGPPCLTFSDKQKNLQSQGKMFETLANVSLGVGAAAALAAGAIWYWEIRESGDDSSDGSVSAAPVLGDDFVGAAAALRF